MLRITETHDFPTASMLMLHWCNVVDVAVLIEKQMQVEPTHEGKRLMWLMLGRHLLMSDELKERTRTAIDHECSKL